MALHIYNTYSRRKEEFVPISRGRVRMYTCGPTVYASSHIGNYRTYLVEDVVRRYLQYKGFKVRHIMNITDLDDIVIREAKRRKIPRKTLTGEFEKKFLREIGMLGNLRAHAYPRASEHTRQMIALAESLVAKKAAYIYLDGNVYFDISKFRKYGALSGATMTARHFARRVKKNDYWFYEAGDFLLWRAKPKSEDEAWHSRFGLGRPAWNLECPAMAMEYLGDHLDLHMGGADNIFSHHENEIAIAETATGKQFVKYWMHAKHLLLDGKKMSKSSGNYVVLEQLLAKGYSPQAIRSYLLSVHYRKRLNFTWQHMKHCNLRFAEFEKMVAAVRAAKGRDSELGRLSVVIRWEASHFESCMDDDMNAPGAFCHAMHLAGWAAWLARRGLLGRIGRKRVLSALAKFDSVLGCVPH